MDEMNDGIRVVILNEVRVLAGTVTAEFFTGDPADPFRKATLMVEDVTAATHHRERDAESGESETRLFHILFEDDAETALAVIQGMAADFREFYRRLRDAAYALKLPEIDNFGYNWWTPTENYMAAFACNLADFHRAFPLPGQTPPTTACCYKPCLAMIISVYPITVSDVHRNGKIATLSLGAVVHQNCPCTPN